MGALVGKEIVQSRVWVDDVPAPELNYKYTFPITVFDAVHETMEEDSDTLTNKLEVIFSELNQKQMIIPAMASTYLMTYGGIAGAVGSIEMSMDIPTKFEDQSNEKIPTEKAVGKLMYSLGLVDDTGEVIDPESRKVTWGSVIGRPTIYQELGNHDDGIVTQKAITDAINNLDNKVLTVTDGYSSIIDNVQDKLDIHTSNFNNPHHVTVAQIHAVSEDTFNFHLAATNPHNVTKEDVGLGNADNTSDLDKPISNAMQAAIDTINQLIQETNDNMNALDYIAAIDYDQPSGILTITKHDGTIIEFSISINNLVEKIIYNPETHKFEVTKLGGNTLILDTSELFIRYFGSVDQHATVSIDNECKIHVAINPKSITSEEIQDNSLTSSVYGDQSIITEKIADSSISTEKYIDQSITKEKIADDAITNSKIASRAVNGHSLFNGAENTILATIDSDSDSVWTKVKSEMIDVAAITSDTIAKNAITTIKLADGSVTNSKIGDGEISYEKFSPNSVHSDTIIEDAITKDHIQSDIALRGTPSNTVSPDPDSNDQHLADTGWVRRTINGAVLTGDNLAHQSVDTSKIKSSTVPNRVLVTVNANEDSTWGLISKEMLYDGIITTSKIAAEAITNVKIADRAVADRNIQFDAIDRHHIKESAVTLDKIETSPNENVVLAVEREDGHPVYAKVSAEMMAENAIGSLSIQDRSVTPIKLQPSNTSNRVMATVIKNTSPVWTQINNGMIADRAVDARTLFTAPGHNLILGVNAPGNDPGWMKINTDMLSDDVIRRRHILDGEIIHSKLAEKSVYTENIGDWTIQSNNIAPRAITGIELFTSEIPNRLLGVSSVPNTNVDFLQVNTDMVEDEAITGDKMFRASYDYRVLASSAAGRPPEYLKLNDKYIVDNSITPAKLKENFILFGRPESTKNPVPDANNMQLATTSWVQDRLDEFSTKIIENGVTASLSTMIINNLIADRSIRPNHLFSSSYAPRVLGVRVPNGNPEYMLIDTNLIANAAITSDKIHRDIVLFGNPTVELRPSPYASDATGDGHLIPDCQWVLDRINGYTSDPSSPSSPTIISDIEDNTIKTQHLQNRSVTGDKLFSSAEPNMVLAVTAANTTPKYVKVTSAMMTDHAISINKLSSTSNENTVLGVKTANSDPAYIKVNGDMIENNSIKNDHLVDYSITNNKLAVGSITKDKLASEALFGVDQIEDNAISTDKIQNNAVETNKIKDQSITSSKLDPNLVLPAKITVESHTDYSRRAVRNTILSGSEPSGGQNGDIWFQYI